MNNGLVIHYDHIGDILYVDRCPPYAEQESDEVGEGIVARSNPQTGAIESIEILFFSQRGDDARGIPIPTDVDLSLVLQGLIQRDKAA